MKKRVNVAVDEALHRRLKAESRKSGRTVQHIVAAALSEYLKGAK